MRQKLRRAAGSASLETLEARRLWAASPISLAPADVPAATPGVAVISDPVAPNKTALQITGGADVLRGQGGGDLLIAGPTTYDPDAPENNAALIDLLGTWVNRDLNYDNSFKAVTSQNGVGASGAHFTDATVTDDQDVDELTGK